MLTGVFIYWGWDSAVTLNEETEDSGSGPGKSAVVSTVILLVTYVLVTTAAQAYGGPDSCSIDNADDVLRAARRRRARVTARQAADHRGADLGARLDADDDPADRRGPRCRWPAPRRDAGALGRVHPRFLTPDVSTIVIGVVSTVWFVVLSASSARTSSSTRSPRWR